MSGGSSGGPNVVTLPESPGRRLRRRILWIGGAVVAVIVVLMLVLLYSPLLAVQTITVEGNKLVPTKTITTALEPLEGTPLPRIGPGRVKDLLADQEAIHDVVVQAHAPGTLEVRIVEFAPVAIVENDSKSYDLVGEDGRTLSSVKKRKGVKLPLIDGKASEQDPEVFSSLTGVLAALPSSTLKKLDHASAQTVDSVELSLTTGQKVLWGSDERSGDKARVLTAFLKDKKQAGVKTFDVSTPDHPVTR
ncbi:MAG: FtsQ-type POTRA domain-containing protein [Micrococcaceae bacterium]|uniref:FtsQ-type POTRA domain-containing protein n=1 Tax=unclassified Arthrobacter TaxID=235627 RepID=UPI0026561D74|nr:FtsQ-type POTRA domain-containing protein [Micrococcaceae bacterium]MDN5812275.1 FtsQ-type POTRA domain-containing protein [Micrococcaceae bacterium]MDN5822861.1 FtsQ-type POTRA domain-containing protein [Micrococcaceae bacterium]MDN5878751.1 FtsQ-type POTRA domain-containing protein [Micrococcaceae bacterium]MDN5885543.1 FtsQ-type POTRA domain-containing protein [Micrococcaceae bacterium]